MFYGGADSCRGIDRDVITESLVMDLRKGQSGASEQGAADMQLATVTSGEHQGSRASGGRNNRRRERRGGRRREEARKGGITTAGGIGSGREEEKKRENRVG